MSPLEGAAAEGRGAADEVEALAEAEADPPQAALLAEADSHDGALLAEADSHDGALLEAEAVSQEVALLAVAEAIMVDVALAVPFGAPAQRPPPMVELV